MFIKHWKKVKPINAHWSLKKDKAINVHWSLEKKDKAINDHWTLEKKDKVMNVHWTLEKRPRLSMFIEYWEKRVKAINVHWTFEQRIRKDKAINDHYRSIKGKFVYWKRIWSRLSVFIEHWKKEEAIKKFLSTLIPIFEGTWWNRISGSKIWNVYWTLKQWHAYQCSLIIDKRTRLWSVKCKSQVFSDTWKKAQK